MAPTEASGLAAMLGKTPAPAASLAAFGVSAAPAPAKRPSGLKRGQLICLLGKPGMGKSSWAAEWPEPDILITNRDQGMLDLFSEGLLPESIGADDIQMATSFGQYKANLEISCTNSCKTLVCEDLRGMQSLCLDHCSQVDHGGDYSVKSFLAFQTGPIQAAEYYFQQLIDIMKRAQTAGKHVICVGHSRQLTTDNKTGEDWLADSLEMDKRFAAIVNAQFMNIFHIVDAVPTERRQGKTKASADFSRWMYVNANPFYLAKNRMGLVGECPFPATPRGAFLKYAEFSGRNPKTMFKV